jgi:hypothetical protein
MVPRNPFDEAYFAQLEAIEYSAFCWEAGKLESLDATINSIIPAFQLSGFPAKHCSGQLLKPMVL